MTAERWQQVRAVLHQALERPPEERSAFLDAACSEDSSLRQEVQSLLESTDEAGATLPRSTPAQRPTLRKGTTFDDYEIQTLLGAGGMGEVYRARDVRLGKDVAIKVLPLSFSADRERLWRFEQEARAAAALESPKCSGGVPAGNIRGRALPGFGTAGRRNAAAAAKGRSLTSAQGD